MVFTTYPSCDLTLLKAIKNWYTCINVSYSTPFDWILPTSHNSFSTNSLGFYGGSIIISSANNDHFDSIT